MHRTDSRTVVLTDQEDVLIDDADHEWDEKTDPRTWVLDRAAEYGWVISDEFVTWIVDHMYGNSVKGWPL